MQSANELLALRIYRDSIIARCAQSEIFARLCADAFVGLMAGCAAVYLVCVFTKGSI